MSLKYKVDCILYDYAAFYTDDKKEAESTFEQYKEDYGDGVRLYEAENIDDDVDCLEWNLIDHYDAD